MKIFYFAVAVVFFCGGGYTVFQERLFPEGVILLVISFILFYFASENNDDDDTPTKNKSQDIWPMYWMDNDDPNERPPSGSWFILPVVLCLLLASCTNNHVYVIEECPWGTFSKKYENPGGVKMRLLKLEADSLFMNHNCHCVIIENEDTILNYVPTSVGYNDPKMPIVN